MCAIYAEVLGLAVDKVGVNDDFFRLGGDSIISIQLVSRLRQKLNLIVTVKDIFSYKNVASLVANVIDKQSIGPVIHATEQGILSGRVALLPIQKWFFNNIEQGLYIDYTHWNQAFMVRMPEQNQEQLQLAIDKLYAHHDGLRLRYKLKGNKLISQSYGADSIKLKVLDVSKLGKEGSREFNTKLELLLTDYQSKFDLEAGPLGSISYLYGYSDGSARLHCAFHHLIIDVVSWRILVKDLSSLCAGELLGQKGSSYRQWVAGLRAYGLTNKQEKSYWEALVKDIDNTNAYLAGLRLSSNLSVAGIELDIEQTDKLLRQSNQIYGTQINDLLLTGLGYSLAELFGGDTWSVTLEGHGREAIDSKLDINNTVGWFTTLYPVKLMIRHNDLFNSIRDVKDSLHQLPNHGVGYGAICGYAKLPRISFNYLGQLVKSQASDWSIVSEESGKSVSKNNRDYHVIDINGVVIDGKLSFSVVSYLGTAVTNKLANSYKYWLEAVIAHCTAVTRSYLSLSDVSYIIDKEQLDRLQEKNEVSGVYRANSLQQGFIYHAINQGEIDDAYRVQLVWDYDCKIVADKLKQAWEYTQARYEALRLRFDWQDQLLQVIDKVGSLDWHYLDISKVENQDQAIREIQQNDREISFNLEAGSLFRIYLIKRSKFSYTSLFSCHHAILDGWSTPILLKYVHETYVSLLQGKVKLVEENTYGLVQEYLQRHDDSDYWLNYLNQLEDKVDFSWLLKPSKSGTNVNDYRYVLDSREEELVISGGLYEELVGISRDLGVTLNVLLQFAWHRLLSVYSNIKQTVIGVTVSGRALPVNGIEEVVGLYINTLPLIVNWDNKTIKEQLLSIQHDIHEMNIKSNVSLASINGKDAFNSLFVYENYPTPVGEIRVS